MPTCNQRQFRYRDYKEIESELFTVDGWIGSVWTWVRFPHAPLKYKQYSIRKLMNHKGFANYLKNINKSGVFPHNNNGLAWKVFNESGYEKALEFVEANSFVSEPLLDAPVHGTVYGNPDEETMAQFRDSLRLPVAVKGALMPDAHLGYGLPIGGVLALDNAVSPYAVGVDIACRMKMTVFSKESTEYFMGDVNTASPYSYVSDFLAEALLSETFFGKAQRTNDGVSQHFILDDNRWGATPLLRELRPVAISQLGTSGSGNHFVEFVIVDVTDTSTGLTGDFASATHEVIHDRIARKLSLSDDVVWTVENHHNYAWAEKVDGLKRVVHRKGATPAGNGVMGVIPGSMAHAGFVVRGKGSPDSLNSASHGAGRAMSRNQARTALKNTNIHDEMRQQNVRLLGGGLDEHPSAYKSIKKVMAHQSDLVDIVATTTPFIVRMAND